MSATELLMISLALIFIALFIMLVLIPDDKRDVAMVYFTSCTFVSMFAVLVIWVIYKVWNLL